MHGAGNDFILVDDRALTFPASDTAWLAAISTRRTGVGCDGVILIQPSQTADFRMRFFNPDGGEVGMCGNGARCVARLAHEIDAAPVDMSIETASGILSAAVSNDSVCLRLATPTGWLMSKTLDLTDNPIAYSFVDTGVPHVVVEVEELDEYDVQTVGSAIRHHADFAPSGTNANFVTLTGPQSLRIRTYERGVEAETLACGTGIVATALVAGKLDRVTPPVAVTCANNDVLEVDYRLSEDGAEDVTLLGPAVHVFEGYLEY